jgi:cation transport ATPase
VVSYIHDLPGRLRVKSTAIKRNPREAERIRSTVAVIEGVSAARVNLRTGSLTVAYECETVSSNQILGAINTMGYALPLASDRPSDVLAKAGEKFVQEAMNAVVSRLVERSAIALVSALL